jgi:hypothetical protein
MGLDMYLTKHIYIGAKYEHREVKGSIDITSQGVAIPVNFNKVVEIIEEAGYWRKANAIHRWFVENVQSGEDNCREYSVDVNTLKELLSLCVEVKTNHEKASELLPTTSGYFFGDTEYNSWYFEDIDLTIEILTPICNDVSDDWRSSSYYYQSSW